MANGVIIGTISDTLAQYLEYKFGSKKSDQPVTFSEKYDPNRTYT